MDAISKYSHIAEFVQVEMKSDRPLERINMQRIRQLLTWMFEKNPETHRTVLGEVRNLGVLNKVLGHPRSREAFLSQSYSLEQAILLSDEPHLVFQAAVEESRRRLREAENNFRLLEESPPAQYRDMLREINSLAYELYEKFQSLSQPIRRIEE